jgi:hypothetical protein
MLLLKRQGHGQNHPGGTQPRSPLKVRAKAGALAPARLNLRPPKQRRIGGMWGKQIRRPPA